MENKELAELISNVLFYSRSNEYKSYPIDRLKDHINEPSAFEKNIIAIENIPEISKNIKTVILDKICRELEYPSNKYGNIFKKILKSKQSDKEIREESNRLARDIINEIRKEYGDFQLKSPADENNMQSQSKQPNIEKNISQNEIEIQDEPINLVEDTTLQYIPEENDESPNEEISDYDEAAIFENTGDIISDKKDEQYDDTPFDRYAVDLMMKMQTKKVLIQNFASLSKRKTCIESIIEQVSDANNLVQFIKNDYPELDKNYHFSTNIINFINSVIQKCRDIIENMNDDSNFNRNCDYAHDLTCYLADAINTYIITNIIYIMCAENSSSNDFKIVLEKIIAFLETLGLYTTEKPTENEKFDFNKFSFFYENTQLIVDNPALHGIVAKVNIPAFFIDYYDTNNYQQRECIKGKITIYTNMS